MTIGDVLAADRAVDLADKSEARQKADRATLAVKKLGPAGALLLDARDAAAQDVFPWSHWKKVVVAVRSLLREPPAWPGWEPDHAVWAMHVVGCFRWAPPVARQVAPKKPLPFQGQITALVGPLRPRGLELAVLRFWANEVSPGGGADAFLGPDEVDYTPDRYGRYQCRECHRPLPRTPSGRMPYRARCEPCQKAWEYTAWKSSNPDKARELWRKSTTAYRRRLRGSESAGPEPPPAGE